MEVQHFEAARRRGWAGVRVGSGGQGGVRHESGLYGLTNG